MARKKVKKKPAALKATHTKAVEAGHELELMNNRQAAIKSGRSRIRRSGKQQVSW